ncbi:MAG: C25 family cysteine peptidase, partial [bacterium]|nr:C25 family cysteine peptidase [bacterium]
VKVRIRFRPSGLGDQLLAPGKAGPSAAGIGRIAAKSAANPNQMAGWASRPAPAKKAKSGVWPDTLPYKILIEEEGIYKIGYYDLLQAGLNPGWFDPRSYKLFNQGREVPIYFKGQADGMFDPDDYFEFYGQRLKGDSSYYHPYSRDNVYWLGTGGGFGARMIEEDGSPVNQNYVLPGSCRYKIHLEKDSLFCRLNSVYSDQTDRWFWRRIDESDSMVYNFVLPGHDSGAADSVDLTLSLHGYTALLPDTFNDHWAIITLNGKSVENNLRWDGQSPNIFRTKLDPSDLSDGQNRLALKHGPLDSIDSYFFNWMEVEYSRRYAADGGALAFKAPSQGSDSLFRYEINGFENQSIDLYKLGVSKITGTVVERNPDGVTYRLTFDDRASAQTGYYAVQNDDQHKLKPKSIVANHIPAQALTDPSQAAQYLIITTEEFLAPAARLAAIRGTQFNGSKVVLASDIYDAFNYGIPADRPIKDFLRQAFMTWQVPPAYVLLFGGGSWDPRNMSGNSASD